jgi:hypothetical protein
MASRRRMLLKVIILGDSGCATRLAFFPFVPVSASGDSLIFFWRRFLIPSAPAFPDRVGKTSLMNQ